jgi:hypothetical protein
MSARHLHIPNFLVVGFTRTEGCEFRAEVVMKASSERHAVALGLDFAGDEQGAIVFSQSDAVPTSDGVGIKILAKFGKVPESSNLWGLLGVLPNKPSIPTHLPARMTPTRSLGSLISRVLFLVATRVQGLRQSLRLSRAITSGLLVVTITGSAGSVLAFRTSGAHRQDRLVEIARPACDHAYTSNQDLHHLVGRQLQAGASTQDALRIVVAQCQNVVRINEGTFAQ